MKILKNLTRTLLNIIIIPEKLMKTFVLPEVSRRRETTLEKYKRKLPRTPFTLLTTPKLKHEPVKTQYV